MKFSISKGTMRFLIDLVYFIKSTNYTSYEEMLKFLSSGEYEDEIDSYSKVFNRSCDDFWTTWFIYGVSKMDLEMFLEEADVYDLPKLRSMKEEIEQKIEELEEREKEEE